MDDRAEISWFRRLDLMHHLADGVMATGAAILMSLVLSVIDPRLAASQTMSRCAPQATVAVQLARNYAEAPIASGRQQNGFIIQVYATADGSTWTVVLTSPNGTSCLVAAGERWKAVSFILPPTGPRA